MVDGAAQICADLRSSTDRFDWASKFVTQALQTLVFNDLLGWRFLEIDSLGGLGGALCDSWNAYRSSMNAFKPIFDHNFDFSKEMLTSASSLQAIRTGSGAFIVSVFHSVPDDLARLQSEKRKRKTHLLNFSTLRTAYGLLYGCRTILSN